MLSPAFALYFFPSTVYLPHTFAFYLVYALD